MPTICVIVPFVGDVPPRLITHTLPERSMAKWYGFDNTEVPYPPTPDCALPELRNSDTLLLLEFTSHTLPRPSSAISTGAFSPPPKYGEPGIAAPEFENRLRLLAVRFATHAPPV